MNIVTGATGRLGHMVVERLIRRVSPDQVGVSVRDPSKADDLARLGVRVRRGDFEDAAGLLHAFEGGTRILVVSPNVTGEAALRQHRAAIGAAKQAGARRILYTSHMAASATSQFPPMHAHAAAEATLAAAGVPYVALRNGFYAESAVMMLGEALTTGELKLPEDGPVAWTAHEDLAEATAAIMAQDEGHAIAPSLAAPEVLDFAAIAALVTEITGLPMRRVVVSDDAFRASLVARGVPVERVAVMMGLFLASRRGEFAKVDGTLAGVIGRAPTTMRAVLAAALPRATA